MKVNQYVRLIRKHLKKEGDGLEFRKKMSIWLLNNLQEEGDHLIKNGFVTKKEQVMKILFLLDEKWRDINKRVQLFNENGWSMYVYERYRIPMLNFKNEVLN